MKNLKKLLGKNAHWQVNKVLARNIGLTEALVLQHLIDLEDLFKKEEIFQPIPQMSEELGVSEYSIKQAIGTLKGLGLVSVERKRVGYMNWYSVNNEKVVEFIEHSDNSPVGTKSTHQREVAMNPTLSGTEMNMTVNTNSTLSETKTNSQIVENGIANNKNTTNNTLSKNTTNNTVSKPELTRLINDAFTTTDKRQIQLIVDDINEIGRDNVIQIMEWEDRQYEMLKNKLEAELGVI